MKSSEKRKIVSVDVGAAKERVGSTFHAVRSKTFSKIADAGVAITQAQINLLTKLRDRAAKQ